MPRRTDRLAAADALLATLFDQTPGEETANALTHALGVVLSLAGLVVPEATLGPGGVHWIVAGGAVHSAGVAFYVLDRTPCNHAVWHLFVLAGSACPFASILLHVVPQAALPG